MLNDKDNKVNAAKETCSTVMGISQLLGAGLDPDTLTICIRLLEAGVNPDALAGIIRELRKAVDSVKSSTIENNVANLD